MPKKKTTSQLVQHATEMPLSVIEQAQHELQQSRVSWFRASRRTSFFITFYLCGFVLFTLLSLFVYIYPVDGIDILITREFQENRTPWLITTMTAISYLGYQPILFGLMILATALIFWLVRLRLEALLVIALSVVSSLLNVLIKLLVARPRPSTHLVDVFRQATGASFPSGHVMSYLAYFGILFSFGVILLKRDRWWHFLVLTIPALFVILVGPSRIYLGAHWASDVLGAYLLGSLLLGLTLWLYLTLRKRGILAQQRAPLSTPNQQATNQHTTAIAEAEREKRIAKIDTVQRTETARANKGTE